MNTKPIEQIEGSNAKPVKFDWLLATLILVLIVGLTLLSVVVAGLPGEEKDPQWGAATAARAAAPAPPGASPAEPVRSSVPPLPKSTATDIEDMPPTF
jgi:hypothetical protein